MKVIFGSEHYTEYLPIASGVSPKFSFEKVLTINIRFDNLDKTYMSIVYIEYFEFSHYLVCPSPLR